MKKNSSIMTLFVDYFVSSCFVHVRKPDADIFRLALDIAQAPARQVVYIENTLMFVQIAEDLGIRSLPPHFTINVLGCGKVADDKPLQYEANGHGGCGTAAKVGT